MTTITLSKPIAHGRQLYGCLKFRPIKFGDMQAMMRAGTMEDLDDLVRFVARLADVPVEVAAQIDPDDLLGVLNGLKDHIDAMAPATPPPSLN